MTKPFKVAVMAQQGLIESWHSRTYLLLSTIVIVCAAIGIFAGKLVLTGAVETSLVVYNFSVRISLVAIISIYTIHSLIREKSDKQIDIMLALDMPRQIYIFGRIAGILLILLIAVMLAALYPLLHINASVVIMWSLSLFAELSMIVSLSIFVAISISNTSASFSIVMGGYLLARNMGNILLLTESPILQGQPVSMEWITFILDVLNLLLPDLWRYAQSTWLIRGEINTGVLAVDILSAALCCLVLITASAIDLSRKNL